MFNFLKKKNPKVKHLEDKILVTNKKIWDLEFLRENLRSMREGFRQEYDRLKEQVDAAEIRILEEKKKEDPDQTIIGSLTRLVERHTPDIEQLKKQMESVESQIEAENGVNATIEGLRLTIGLLRDYKKQVEKQEL